MKLIPLTAVLLSALAASAAAQGVPTIDVGPSCRAAAAGILQQDTDACQRSEDAARATLVSQWNRFPSGDRSSCYRLTTTGTPGTYTELLTCLEMKQAVRNSPDRNGTVGFGGARR